MRVKVNKIPNFLRWFFNKDRIERFYKQTIKENEEQWEKIDVKKIYLP